MSTITRLRLSFKVEQLDGQVLLRTCSQLFHQRVHTELDRLIDRFAKRMTRVREIEQLVVDLGTLDAADWPAQWRVRLLQRVEQAFIEALSRVPRALEPANEHELCAIVQPRHMHTTERCTRLDAEQHGRSHPGLSPDARLAALGHWLQTGQPCASALWQASGPDQWLHTLLETTATLPAPYAIALATHCLSACALQRLQQTFQEPTLMKLAMWLTERPACQGPRLAVPPWLKPDRPALWPDTLSWAALVFFQQHPTLPMPTIGDAPSWHAATQPLLKQLLCTFPMLRVETISWLERLCAAASLRAAWTSAHPLLPPSDIERSEPIARSGCSPELLPAELLPVSNAGLVLLWPLLPDLFRTLALLDEHRFVDVQASLIATGWLNVLAWGDDMVAEWRNPVNHLLCGVPLEAMLFDWSPLAEPRAQLDAWLNALPARLPGLQRCGPDDLRALFLQRAGTLVGTANMRWMLQVEPHAADVLLREIPWPLEQVWLPWLADPITVEWRR